MHDVVECGGSIRDRVEQGERLSGSEPGFRFFVPVPGDFLATEGAALFPQSGSHLGQLILVREAPPHLAGLEQGLDIRPVPLDSVRLVDRRLIDLEAEPLHRVQDLPGHFVARPLPVGILDAEQKASTLVPGELVVEQSSPSTPDMKVPRRAWSKSNAW
jgi:hypothetical protein